MSINTGSYDEIVSIIIPCYNHGRYLARAIESVLYQDYGKYEIIVVDDGSVDNTKTVAENYHHCVKYIYQQNQGLSAARNTGIDNSTGPLLVFLDADDWLFPEALSTNLSYLQENPGAGFVSGAFINLYHHFAYPVKYYVNKDHYNHLLVFNYIAMHAAVMYRRMVFDKVRYDVSLKAAEDYDVYLRIARIFPIITHTKQIAVYNRHDSNMSGNYPMMLEYTLHVLNQQKDVLRNDTEREALKEGIKYWTDHYCLNIYVNLGKNLKLEENKKKAMIDTLKKHHKAFYYKYLMLKPFGPVKRSLLKGNNDLVLKSLSKAGLNKNFKPSPGKIQYGDLKRVKPFSTNFGYERGGPVDRYYIEKFLTSNSSLIKGRVLEIGDNEYTLLFGGSRVIQSDILHVNNENSKASFIGDLSNAPELPSGAFDCIVLTQTLQFIYDYRAALQTCYRILKPGGSLLMTVPGISHIDQGEWRKLWMYSFSESVIIKALSEFFPVNKVEVQTFGNVLVASAFLYGLGLPELKKEQLDYYDSHYQVIITSVAVKPE